MPFWIEPFRYDVALDYMEPIRYSLPMDHVSPALATDDGIVWPFGAPHACGAESLATGVTCHGAAGHEAWCAFHEGRHPAGGTLRWFTPPPIVLVSNEVADA